MLHFRDLFQKKENSCCDIQMEEVSEEEVVKNKDKIENTK